MQDQIYIAVQKNRPTAKRVLWLCFVLLPCFSFLNAQNLQGRVIDSLKKVLQSETDDSNKVNTLIKLTEKLEIAGSYDSSLTCAEAAKALAEKTGFEKGEAISLIYCGINCWEKGNFKQALEYEQKALDLAKKINNQRCAIGA